MPLNDIRRPGAMTSGGIGSTTLVVREISVLNRRLRLAKWQSQDARTKRKCRQLARADSGLPALGGASPVREAGACRNGCLS